MKKILSLILLLSSAHALHAMVAPEIERSRVKIASSHNISYAEAEAHLLKRMYTCNLSCAEATQRLMHEKLPTLSKSPLSHMPRRGGKYSRSHTAPFGINDRFTGAELMAIAVVAGERSEMQDTQEDTSAPVKLRNSTLEHFMSAEVKAKLGIK